MAKVLTPTRRRQLLDSLLHARHDLLELMREFNLKPEALASFGLEAQNQRVLHGLCVLADLQTQVLLSRYRLIAASRLIRLAGGEGDCGPDVARRACVDLLRLDLPRADLAGEEGEGDPPTPTRAALYGAEEGY